MSIKEQSLSRVKSWLQRARWRLLIWPQVAIFVSCLALIGLLAWLSFQVVQSEFERQVEQKLLNATGRLAIQLEDLIHSPEMPHEALIHRLKDARFLPYDAYPVLIDQQGELLYYPPTFAADFHRLRTLERIGSRQLPSLEAWLSPAVLERLLQDQAGLLPLPLVEGERWLVWRTLDPTGWKLLLVIDQSLVSAGLQRIGRDYLLLAGVGALILLWFFFLMIWLQGRRDQRLMQWIRRCSDEQVTTTEQEASGLLMSADTHGWMKVVPGPLLICYFDQDGCIQASNKAFEHFAGMPASVLQGRPVASSLQMESLPDAVWADEVKLSGYDGKSQSWWVSSCRTHQGDGYLFMLDMTHYNQSQQQLRDEQLRSQQAMRLQTEFLQVISREAHRLVSELHQLRFNPSAQLQDAESSLNELTRLLDDLQDMVDRPDISSNGQSKLPSLSLRPLIKRVADSIEGRLHKQQRHLDWSLSDNLPQQLVLDQRRLERLLNHLLRQVSEVYDQGDIRLQVDWNAGQQQLTWVFGGQTQKKPDPSRILGQLSATPVSQGYEPSSGALGLAPLLTRQLLRDLQGRFWMRPLPEQDSFELVLEMPARTPEAAKRLQGHILLVDDGPVNAVLASSLLERAGYEVDVASSGSKALKMAEVGRYDLVLMDIYMPNMSGIETTQHWRKLNNTNASIPVIALTANTFDGDRDYYLAQGMDDYLAKPYPANELLALVERWIGRTTRS